MEAVLATMKQNSDKAVKVLLHAIPRIAEIDWSKTIAARKV